MMDTTLAPTTPADIAAKGVLVSLVTIHGTVLDEVVYTAKSCRAKVMKSGPRVVECKVEGGQGPRGKLSLNFQMPTRKAADAPFGNATVAVAGSWRKRAIHGVTAAAEAPLGVVVEVPESAAFKGMYVVVQCIVPFLSVVWLAVEIAPMRRVVTSLIKLLTPHTTTPGPTARDRARSPRSVLSAA